MRTARKQEVIGAAIAFAVCQGVGAQTPRIEALGVPSWAESSTASGLSANGRTAIGIATASGGTSWKSWAWTHASGLAELPALLGAPRTTAVSVSGDGASIFGFFMGGVVTVPNGYSLVSDGVRWRGGIAERLQPLLGVPNVTPRGLTADGVWMFGCAGASPTQGIGAMRWRSDGSGPVEYLPAAANFYQSFALAVSGDGSIFVGEAQIIPSATRPIRWDDDGVHDLGTLAGFPNGSVWALSNDGGVAAGYCYGPNTPTRACMWNSSVIEELGQFGGFDRSVARCVSANGAIIAGSAWMPGSALAAGTGRAFIWTRASGMQDLNLHAAALGVDLSHWTLTDVAGISADGTVLSGTGINEILSGTSRKEAWVMHLSTQSVCAADFNHANGVDVQDIFDFLAAWFEMNPAADFNGGGLSVSDIFDFLSAWFAGC